MESINRVELTGSVGKTRQALVGDRIILQFSLATHSLVNETKGEIIMETTWHNVTAVQSSSMPDLSYIKAGDIVHVTGRIRQRQVRTPEGTMGTVYDIIAHSLECSRSSEYTPENFSRQ